MPHAARPIRLGAALLLAAGSAAAGGLASGCARPAAHGGVIGGGEEQDSSRAAVTEADVRRLLSALADDSMQGRAAGTPGALRAARLIAAELATRGIRPAGDSAFFQRVPGAGVNVVGRVPGTDSAAGAVVVAAHYDHLGVGPAVAGDSIYNGADDDASGVVAVVEAAGALARGPAPRRTVVVLLTTGEERGLLGTDEYLRRPVVPLARTAAELEVEMIGRPDSLAGGPGRAWLTGFERSTLGDMLRRAGLPVVADPRPAEGFFERSDNIAFARRGIPAHTLSSFGLHADYHAPADEVARIDFGHMTRVVRAVADAVRLLADGPAPRWNTGGRP